VNGAANATSGVSALRASIPVASNAACACGAQTILSLTVQAITVLARSTPLRGVLRQRFAPKNGVTSAARRDPPKASSPGEMSLSVSPEKMMDVVIHSQGYSSESSPR
jgi:hypothetical protein